jgi:hypothetical protein
LLPTFFFSNINEVNEIAFEHEIKGKKNGSKNCDNLNLSYNVISDIIHLTYIIRKRYESIKKIIGTLELLFSTT